MEKQTQFTIVFNWKKEKARIVSKKYKTNDPYEILIRANLKFIIAEKKELEVNGEINVSDVQATKMMLKELEGDKEE